MCVGNGEFGSDHLKGRVADAVERDAMHVVFGGRVVDDGVRFVVEVSEVGEGVSVPDVVEGGDEVDGVFGCLCVGAGDSGGVFEEEGVCVSDVFECADDVSCGGDAGDGVVAEVEDAEAVVVELVDFGFVDAGEFGCLGVFVGERVDGFCGHRGDGVEESGECGGQFIVFWGGEFAECRAGGGVVDDVDSGESVGEFGEECADEDASLVWSVEGGGVGVREADLFCAADVCAGHSVPDGAGVESGDVEVHGACRACHVGLDEESGVGFGECERVSFGDGVLSCPRGGEADDVGVAGEFDDASRECAERLRG